MKYFSGCSGIGSVELALKKLWPTAKCVGYSEVDRYAIKTYRLHFPEHKNYGDIRKIEPRLLPSFDLFVAGFPCQAFSIAGKRRGFEDTRGTIFFEISRIIKEVKPRILIFENVKGLLNHDRGQTFTIILQTLDELGYDAEWQVLNSKNFGVPQNRERIFIIGHLRGSGFRPIFPIFGTGSKDVREITKRVSRAVRVYNPEGIGVALAANAGGLGAKTGYYAMRWSRTEKGKEARRKAMANGKDYTPFNEGHRKLVRSKENVSGCVTGALNKDALLGDGIRIRKLTPVECERLQGFPDGYTSAVSETQRYKQLGNTITVPVVEAIIKKVKEIW
jgi:DNA (cytosine-5)-methyltransferase 1